MAAQSPKAKPSTNGTPGDAGAEGDAREEEEEPDPPGAEQDDEGEDFGANGEEIGGDDCDAGTDNDNEWEEMYACPLTVRFTQDKIHPFFYRRGPIVNVVPKIRPVVHAHGANDDEVELVPPFTPIHCLRKGEELWSLDNRRLYALQLAAMDQWPQRCRVRLLCRDRLPRHKFKTQYRKFNTTSAGRAIEVTARYQQFDVWNWFDRAVELEWCALSSRLGSLLSVFEVAPIVGALLFRTGLTGFSTRAPLIIGFIVSFSVDLLRQRVPAFERKICEIHVKAVMDGDVRHVDRVCRRRRGSDPWQDSDASPTSAAQLASMMALALVLIVPYVLGVARPQLRSSLVSCWLGVACVLVVQLGHTFLRGGDTATFDGESSATGPKLSPKHREDTGGNG